MSSDRTIPPHARSGSSIVGSVRDAISGGEVRSAMTSTCDNCPFVTVALSEL